MDGVVQALTEWRNRLFTWAVVCGRALLHPTVLGVAALCINDRGQVLLVRPRLNGGWTLPGGGVDPGEPPAEAVLRELEEEAGHRGGVPHLAGLHVRRVLWATNVVALYRIEGGDCAFAPNFEIAEAGWFDVAALPANTHAGVRRRLAELRDAAPPSPYW